MWNIFLDASSLFSSFFNIHSPFTRHSNINVGMIFNGLRKASSLDDDPILVENQSSGEFNLASVALLNGDHRRILAYWWNDLRIRQPFSRIIAFWSKECIKNVILHVMSKYFTNLERVLLASSLTSPLTNVNGESNSFVRRFKRNR